MSEPVGDAEGAEFREDLRRWIQQHWGDTSAERLANWLEEVADELEATTEPLSDAAESGAPALGAGLLSSVTQPVVGRVAADEDTSTIQVSVDDDEMLSQVLKQLQNVGGILVQVDETPELNAKVQVHVEVPGRSDEFWAEGRVVYRHDPVTAVELIDVNKTARDTIRGLADSLDDWPSDVSPVATIDGSGEPDVDSTFMGMPSAATDTDRPGLRESSVRTNLTESSPADLKDPDVIGYAVTQELGRREEASWYWHGPGSTWVSVDDADSDEVRTNQDFSELLLELSNDRFSGVVEFESRPRQVQIWFDEGFIAHLSTRPQRARDELGPMLRMAKRISKDELAEAASHAHENEHSLERSLLELGIMDAETIRRASAGRISYLLQETCDGPTGRAVLFPEDVIPEPDAGDASLRAHVAAELVVFRRRYERFNQLSVDDRMGLVDAHGHTYPICGESAAGRIERAFTDAGHKELVRRLIDGRRPLDEVVTASFLPPAETVSVIFALRSAGLVELASAGRDPDFARREMMRDIHVKHLSVHKASYFEVINVHWSSFDEEVHQHYRWCKEKFSWSDPGVEVDRTDRKKLEEIQQRLDKAYDVLRDRPSRHEYRQKIMPGYKLQHAVSIFRKKAELARRREQWEEAQDALRRLLEIQPDDPRAGESLEETRAHIGDAHPSSVTRTR
jgi:hypothetical protein